MSRVFKAEVGDVFTSFKPDDLTDDVYVYRGSNIASIESLVRGWGWSTEADDSIREDDESELTPAQVNAWASANDIRIEWPDEQPATCKPDLQVQPLSFREQAAIALFMKFYDVIDTPSLIKKLAVHAFDAVEILDAERVARGGGRE